MIQIKFKMECTFLERLVFSNILLVSSYINFLGNIMKNIPWKF